MVGLDREDIEVGKGRGIGKALLKFGDESLSRMRLV